ncbi:MAG: hypothetical protein H0V56_12975 [Chthoniobacterales bacterium]|nr:hypothetical protein [Chthoniobacterales bacterium]
MNWRELLQPRPVEHHAFERVAMRVLFAWVVWRHVPGSLAHLEITAPHGVARWFDLRFLLDPQVYTWCTYGLWVALALYVLRIGWSVALPYMAVLSIGVGTVINSQGAIAHYLQIVSLVLCAQTAAHFYSLFGIRDLTAAAYRAAAEDRVVRWSQQAIVATYLVSALTKLLKTNGLWFFQSPLLAVQITKTNDQDYYDRLDTASYEAGAAVAEWMVQNPLLVGLVLSTGLLLELTAPLVLFARWLALGYGLALVLFHMTVHQMMKLNFLFNEYLLWIYLVNVPFWILFALRFGQRRMARAPA